LINPLAVFLQLKRKPIFSRLRAYGQIEKTLIFTHFVNGLGQEGAVRLMILCDTDILIEFYKNNPHIFDELRYIQPHNLAISVITQAPIVFWGLEQN